MLAVPAVSDGDVSTVKIEGSGWSKPMAPTARTCADRIYRRVIAVPRHHVDRRVRQRGLEQRAPHFTNNSVGVSLSS